MPPAAAILGWDVVAKGTTTGIVHLIWMSFHAAHGTDRAHLSAVLQDEDGHVAADSVDRPLGV